MTTFRITFDLRDALRGSRLLEQLGLTEDVCFSDSHDLEMDDAQLDQLREEVEALDLGFDFEELA